MLEAIEEILAPYAASLGFLIALAGMVAMMVVSAMVMLGALIWIRYVRKVWNDFRRFLDMLMGGVP